MGRKEIQEQRIRQYFLDATKEILKGEGIRAISVRNIAERAGYSYATLYNYFKDVKDLIFECVQDFQTECRDFIESEIKETAPGRKRIAESTLAYMKYFIQYPGIFELFFIENTGSLSQKSANIELIYNFLERLCEADWNEISAKEGLSGRELTALQQQLNYLTTGMLLLFITRKFPANYQEFMKISRDQVYRALSLGGQ